MLIFFCAILGTFLLRRNTRLASFSLSSASTNFSKLFSAYFGRLSTSRSTSFFRCPLSESSGVERHGGSRDTDYVLTSCSVIPLYPPSKGEAFRFDALCVNRADTACLGTFLLRRNTRLAFSPEHSASFFPRTLG